MIPPILGKRESRGISLVIVLGSLVFLSALVVAFLVQMGTELKASKMAAHETTSRILAQSASNIVMTQIKAGTKGVNPAGNTLAWVSQPGMIRTYDIYGQPDQYFKLYSDDLLVGDGPFNPAAAAPPTNWAKQTALYTDLNQPVQVGTSTYFPIIDGNGIRPLTKIPAPTTGTLTVPSYLGYDVNKDTLPDVDGFSVDATKVTYDSAKPVSSTNSPVPMPAKWLYVLANGKIVAPKAGADDKTVEVDGSDESPVIGRIAFWTDDETCKLNINTASEGTYWDIPRFNQPGEITLAKNQPVQNEYQRYPGHPAMTSLSTVLKGLTTEQLFDILPRVMPGGSKSGTVLTTMTAMQNMAPLVTDTDRLYTSVDELLFKHALASDQSRQENNPTALNSAALQKSKFFLTASSRAPDVNLFNLPRISTWPVRLSESTKVRTPYDSLIAFCTTVGGHIFHFQRKNPYDQMEDLPADLPFDDSEELGLKRNTRLLAYLRTLASRPIPGFGSGTFETKYPQDMDQIFTEIFDYVRSTNLKDTSTPGLLTYTNPTTLPPTGGMLTSPGGGVVVPITGPNNTRGFGRFPTVHGAFLHFIADDSTGLISPPPAGFIRVQAGFFVQLFDPSLGFADAFPNYTIQISKLNRFEWRSLNSGAAQPMGFPSTGKVNWVGFLANQERYWGGVLGYSQFSRGKNNYPFISGTLDLPVAETSFRFEGGDIEIELIDPSGKVAQKVTLNFPGETFPRPNPVTPALLKSQWDAPTYWRKFTGSVTTGGTTYSGRLLVGTSSQDSIWIRQNTGPGSVDADVVREICAVTDMRTVVPRKEVTPADNLYAPHPSYTDSSKFLAHSLRFGSGGSFPGATWGRLVNNTLAPSAPVTDLPPSINGVSLGKMTSPPASGDLPGDWDNGFGYLRDGAYIGKADEGERGTNKNNDPNASEIPYFPFIGADALYHSLGQTYFSANRMIPSAGVFGSLPTGVWSNRPWQTLLFRPGPAGHPGAASPKDHLLLDLFHMPVVEPYAISEPLSTAGRINMNYQIVPYSYLTRNTGIQAILKAEKVIAVQNNADPVYRQASTNGVWNPNTYRYPVDIKETLLGFKAKFDVGDVFKSASEICELPIVPYDTGSAFDTYASMSTTQDYWNTKRLTGDNSRERPYTTIYPRLTTKSNTFTVHVRAQALKKVRNTDVGVWVEGRDQVIGEYRGSQTIERYVDPNSTALKQYDYALSSVTKPISDFYRFRVLDTKQFAP